MYLMIEHKRHCWNKIRQLEDVVAATVGESKTLEAKIEEYSLNEAMLKEKIELLEKEKEEVLNEAVVEGDKVLTLEYNIKELNTALNEAREVLSLKTEELEHLSQEIANLKEMHENKVRELEDVVAAAVGESKTLEDKIEEYSLNEATLKEKIELLEKEKEEVLNQVAVEGGKVLTLQSNIKELNTALNEAGEILSLKTEELEHLRQEISNLKEMHKNEIKQLQSDTTEVKLKINFLETCIKMVETSKRTLEEELKQLQIEEERLLNSITSETEKTFIQNKRLEELTSSVEDLQIQLSLKTEEYDELKRELINAKSFTEAINTVAPQQWGRYIMVAPLEVCTKEEQRAVIRFLWLEGVKGSDMNKQITVDEVASALNIGHGAALQIIHKKLGYHKVCAWWVPRKLTAEHKLTRVRSMMSELEEAKSIISHLENQVKELSNKSLNEKFLFEKMEKDRINEELTFQTENTDLLDSVLQEQEISAQRLQAIFLQKEEECKQLSSELANLQVLYEEKIHEHEDQLSSSKSEKDLLENQLTACLTKQNLLREKLESFAIAKSIVHELLSTETGKVQMLAVGLGEIKADLINLQSVLSQSDAHYVNYSSKKGDQKDSLKNSLCKICLSKNREPEIISGIQQKINSIEFGSLIREALMFQNLKEKVCFSELNESTFNTFTHLCSLEKNLVDKLTKCETKTLYSTKFEIRIGWDFSNSGLKFFQILDPQSKSNVKEIIYEIEKLKREIARAQKRIDTLQHCYEVEKIKNINLSTVIEEVENKLSRVYLEKEKLKVKFLDAKKLFTHVQNLINIKSGLSAMEIDIDSFSESCFCEICETGSDGTCSLDEYQHDILKPINLLKSLVEFIATHNNLKTEIEQIQRDMSDFQAENADLHSKIAELKTELKGMAELKTKIKQMRTDESDFQAENTIVQSTDVELKTDLESVKEKETVILNSECDRLTKISENMSSLNCKKDCLILNLEETETELDNSVISKSEKLIEHGKALHGVHAENSKTNLCPNYKEEIPIFQNSIQEKEKALEQMSLKCENYEKEINDLNAKLYRFEVDKEVLQTSEQQSKKIISELQKKVKSLEQSKISLNLTIENVEEELQSIYSEKQELQNKLDELAAQTNNSSKTKDLEHDILFWKDKYEEEKKSVDILSRNLEELEKMKQDNEIYCEELKNRNKILETDVMILKNIKFEHECALLEKISNSEHNLITITQLKQKISDIKTEKLELESKIKEVEVNLYCKQETEIALHNEIQNLKLKDMIEDKKEDGKIIEELKKKICSEGINMQNELQEALEKQYAKEKIALKKLNQELEEAHADVKQIKAINCELNSEISLLKANQTSQTESYKKKYDDLFTKFIHQQDENQNLKLKISSNANTFNNNLSSELQNAKTALTTAKNFIVKILNLIINMVESYSLHEEYETGKSDLISLKVAWEQSIEVLLKSEFKLQNDISTWLVSFFKAFNFSKEIQVMLQNISKSICNFASETEEHPETFIDNQMSCGEYINDISCDNKFTIENKKEMNHQKEMLEEMSLKFKATLSDEQKNKHGNPPEPKFNIIRLNYRRLEKKHENLLKTCEEMEQRIKGLEEEKQNLEDE
ncbi:putative leucine-rich repeat-containing protein DDB_G0290503, partial [Stegodyphus dumicola]|uniref:putative leucine-rich repeat-containing protein DDB_G0290503 n=1 Tax=Stegodyphus dumicola TaxID=202533 RepID=UPI0015AEDBAE